MKIFHLLLLLLFFYNGKEIGGKSICGCNIYIYIGNTPIIKNIFDDTYFDGTCVILIKMLSISIVIKIFPHSRNVTYHL